MDKRLLFTMVLCTAVRCEDTCKSSSKRPIYVIGHMVNSIGEVKKFLDMGSNVLESDVTFHENGTVKKIFHGDPCECERDCSHSATLDSYLDYIRQITDPAAENNYYKKMILQFFDLKLDNVKQESKETAGREMADYVLDHLWGEDNRRNPVKVLMFIYKIVDQPAIAGFIRRFRERGVENMLKYVGFDGGMDPSDEIAEMFSMLGIKDRIWQGDGTINCDSAMYPDDRLLQQIYFRDTSNGYINKVYHWNIDERARMRKSLTAGVDGMITNRPDILLEVMKEEPFASMVRIATVDDDPFANYVCAI